MLQVFERSGRECCEYINEALVEHARQVVNSTEKLLDDLFRISALYEEILTDVQAAGRCMERHYDDTSAYRIPSRFIEDKVEPEDFHYEPLVDVGRRAFREAVVGYVEGNEAVLDKWLEAVIGELQAGPTLSDSVKQNVTLLSDAFQSLPAYYYEHIERPFIRAGVTYYHGKARKLAGEAESSEYEEATNEWIRAETEAAEVFLREPHRPDYLATLAEFFDLGKEKFQRPS
ncbi:hypothetical protein AAVH_15852 [Aphelenchoides avenae]|nr:hypothetical protein AAVH_15852 [Aphelenchus avenae]